MPATENKAFLRRYFEALSGKEKPRALQDEYIADSDQELKEHILYFETAFPRYELIEEDMIAEGDKVTVLVTFKGTHTGEFMGIAPTGKDVAIPIMLIYRIAGGKIVDHYMLADQLGLMQQLGAIPT